MQIKINKITLIIFFILTSFSNTLAQEEYSLNDLYRIALERAERIRLSEEDLYIAERGKDKALSVLLPRLSAFGNYTRYSESKISGSGWPIQPDWSTSWGLRLDQSLSLSGKELTAFTIAKENIEKGRYDLNAVKETYLLNISITYYDVLRAKKAVEIAKANVERLKKHRDAAAIRLKIGEVTKTTLLRAEAELSGAESELVRVENNLILARAVLARVVGINGDYDVKESVDSSQYTVDSKGIESIESLKQTALSERAELKSIEFQKRITEDQVKFIRGAYWPTLSIEGVYSKKDEDPASPFLNKESIYGGIKLNFPFFEGGLRRAEVREAEARQKQAELVFEDLKKTISIEVENAYLDLKTQAGILKSLEDQLTFARDNYNAISKQFEFGLANSIDVMDANTLLVTAQRQLADAKYNYQLSILRLKRATGTLLKTVISQACPASQSEAGESKVRSQDKFIGEIEK
ncbi:MAG: TolC family protein [Nitrospirae bacterium]|nr:TolC family protein [Nitrospirota bacterium]